MSIDFFQEGPELANQYRADHLLQAYLRQKMPAEVLAQAQPELERMGERAAGEFAAWAEDAERVDPRHVPFDPWGRRIDDIVMSPGWEKLAAAAAEEGIVATGYERR